MNFENPSIKTIFIMNIFIVLSFAIIYIIIGSLGNQFNNTTKTLNLFDAVYLSMTIQSSVGFGDITPKTKLAKFFVLIHQSLILLNISFPSLKFLYDALNKNSSSAPAPATATAPAPAPAPNSGVTTAPLNIISKYSSYTSDKLNNFLKQVESKR